MQQRETVRRIQKAQIQIQIIVTNSTKIIQEKRQKLMTISWEFYQVDIRLE